ncbi:MAG TPA: aminotransferase class III-fold pyridoxal phosphate-dependent enzyme [Candidatus Paceibacterota bacterium]
MYTISLKPQKIAPVKTKFRTIKTTIPSSSFIKTFSKLSKYEPQSLLAMIGKLPVLWDRAVDFQVFDKDGNCWIDFTSTIFVANTGHANPRIAAALKSQLAKPLLHSYTYATDIKAEFLEKLIKVTPKFCERAILFSGGSEATEAAFLMMKAHGKSIDKSRTGIISFEGAMHGVTMASQMLSGNSEVLSAYGYSDPTVYRLPFPFPWDDARYSGAERFKKDISVLIRKGMKVKNIAGFMVEAYRGWGVIFYPSGYVKALVNFARQNNILVAFDEIQGGFGRTGKIFTFQHYDVVPDLVLVGKGLSSSLPLSAVLGRKEIFNGADSLDVYHSTHSGNPLSCAAGLANLEELESKNLVKESARKGKILLNRLNVLKKKYKDRIAYVNGKGLIAAVLFKDPQTGKPDGEFASRVCERAMQKGLLLVHTGRESIKIAPPLTILDAALREGIHVFSESIAEISVI